MFYMLSDQIIAKDELKQRCDNDKVSLYITIFIYYNMTKLSFTLNADRSRIENFT